jgi:tetratricopeptide (TPR) repeat protein
VERAAAIAAARVRQGLDPEVAYLLVADLANALRERLGPDHPATVGAFQSLADRARDRGDHLARIAALRRVLAAYDRLGDAEQGLTAALGVAEALADAGDTERCLSTYEDAAARAERIGRASRVSRVLFDWGLVLQESGQAEPAAVRLGEALAAARRAGEPGLLGGTAAAYGICLQHLGRPAEARKALEEGLAVLDKRDEAAFAARAHLLAILDGVDCGCLDQRAAIAGAYREFVVSRTPADLLDRFDVRIVRDSFMVDVEFRRPPTPEEVQALNEALHAGKALLA